MSTGRDLRRHVEPGRPDMNRSFMPAWFPRSPAVGSRHTGRESGVGSGPRDQGGPSDGVCIVKRDQSKETFDKRDSIHVTSQMQCYGNRSVLVQYLSKLLEMELCDQDFNESIAIAIRIASCYICRQTYEIL